MSGLEVVSNGSLSILRGNLFACNSIPQNDEYWRDYVCGSRNLNDSLFVFVSAFGMAMLVVLLGRGARLTGVQRNQHWLVAALHSRCMFLWTHLSYMKNLNTRGLNSIYSPIVRKVILLSDTFVEVMQNAMQLLVVILVGSLALYLVKALDFSEDYETHSKTYSWFWTLAYMRGVVPAGMLMLLWTGAISACFYRIIVLPLSAKGGCRSETYSKEVAPEKPATSATTDEAESFPHHVVPIGVAFIFNACITITVNTLYIYSTQQALEASVHFCIQLSLSIFRLVYVVVAFPLLARPIRSVVENVRFRFILLSINNLLLPCVVTALTSDACFQVFDV